MFVIFVLRNPCQITHQTTPLRRVGNVQPSLISTSSERVRAKHPVRSSLGFDVENMRLPQRRVVGRLEFLLSPSPTTPPRLDALTWRWSYQMEGQATGWILVPSKAFLKVRCRVAVALLSRMFQCNFVRADEALSR